MGVHRGGKWPGAGRKWSDDVNLCPWDLASFFAACAALAQQNQLWRDQLWRDQLWRVRVDSADRDVFFVLLHHAAGALGHWSVSTAVRFSREPWLALASAPTSPVFSGSLTRAMPEPAAVGMFGAWVRLLGLFAGLRRRYNRGTLDLTRTNNPRRRGCSLSGRKGRPVVLGLPPRPVTRRLGTLGAWARFKLVATALPSGGSTQRGALRFPGYGPQRALKDRR